MAPLPAKTSSGLCAQPPGQGAEAGIAAGLDEAACCTHPLPLAEMVFQPSRYTATEAELAVLSSHTPALAVRARRAKSQAASSWQSAAAAAPHIWLALPSMEPGATAPISYPLGESCMPPARLLVSQGMQWWGAVIGISLRLFHLDAKN